MRNALAQPHTKQFLKFAVVGLISFGVDWGMLIALVELFHFDFLMSTTVSFTTSVVVNYWLSMKYVFDHREGMSRKREFTIFTILSVIGLLTLLVAVVMGIYTLVSHFTGNTVSGWSSLMISIWFLGGLNLLALGIVGEYIGKIYSEVKQRPRYLVEETLGMPEIR